MVLKVDAASAWHDVLDLQVIDGGAFRRVLNGYVNDGAGNWQPCYTYNPNITTTTSCSVSSSTVTAPSGTVTISGTVTPALGTVPTGSTVELYNGATKLLTTTTNSSAQYSFAYQPSVSGVYNLTVKFVTNGYYQASSVAVPTITASASSTVNVTSIPGHAVKSQAFSVGGNVSLSTGETATGSVTAQYYNGSSWVTMGSATLASGAFTISCSAAIAGYFQIRIQYGGATYFLAGTYSNSSYLWYPPAPGGFTMSQGALSNGSGTAGISWTGSSDATDYFVYFNGSAYGVGGATSWAVSVSADTRNQFYVVARNQAADGTYQYATSNVLYAYPGHPQQVNSGSNDALHATKAVWSYNSHDGWIWAGTMFQGQHTSGGYTRNWYGVATFSPTDLQNYFKSNFGIDDPASRLTILAANLKYTRPVVSGQPDPIDALVYFSTTTAGVGGTPNLHNGPHNQGLLYQGDDSVIGLPDVSWGTALISGSEISVAIYSSATTEYGEIQNISLELDVTWNYVSVAQVAAYWSTS